MSDGDASKEIPRGKINRRQFFRLAGRFAKGAIATGLSFFLVGGSDVLRSPTTPTPQPTPPKEPPQLPLAPLKKENEAGEKPKLGRVTDTSLGDWDPTIDESLCKNHEVKEGIKRDWKDGRRVFAIALKRKIGSNEAEIDLLPISDNLPEEQEGYDLNIFYALADKTGENLVPFDSASIFKKIESPSIDGRPTDKPPTEFSDRNFTLISIRLFNPNGKPNQPPEPPFYEIWVPKLAARKDAVIEGIRKVTPSFSKAQFILSPETPVDIIWVKTRVVERERMIITPQGKKEIKKEYLYTLPLPEA